MLKHKQIHANGVVQEMGNSVTDGSIEIPLAPGVDIAQLTEGDANPLFVTIDALSDTISGNKRRWTAAELHRVAEQVMAKKPDGYRGHLTQEERKSKAPDAVTIWIGAKVAKHEGRDRLFIKGYVMPQESKFKDYLRRAKTTGKNIAVSVYGQAMEKWNETIGAFDISNFNLESIDWARPGAEGVPNSGFLKLTTEMDEGDVEMTLEEALASASAADIRQHAAPAVVQEIETEAQSELTAVVSEMTTITGVESADLTKTVQEMSDRNAVLTTQVAESEVDKILGNKIPNVAARASVRKMVVGEMAGKDVSDLKVVQEIVETQLNSDEGKALQEAFKTQVVPGANQDNRDIKPGRRFTKK